MHPPGSLTFGYPTNCRSGVLAAIRAGDGAPTALIKDLTIRAGEGAPAALIKDLTGGELQDQN